MNLFEQIMSKTSHKIIIANSQNMSSIAASSVDLVVTSPPYPMIEMWDDVFNRQNGEISDALKSNPDKAFELMHRELDKVWGDCFRVLKEGSFMCINIGDATRTIDGNFRLYDNKSRISQKCSKLGFTTLPSIIWRKQTNAPNKFMGSGMLPCGAYVTMEHESILVFRKGSKRKYLTSSERLSRMKSSFFWEERNVWFSDLWDVKGVQQKLTPSSSRERSGAYPFEIPYRLINMFSQKGDVILDPFLGTGTTMRAAVLSGRNSIGYEIDVSLLNSIRDGFNGLDIDKYNSFIKKRYDAHVEFVDRRISSGREVKHFNKPMNIPVMTKQEEEIEFQYLRDVSYSSDNEYSILYEDNSDMSSLPLVLCDPKSRLK